MTITGRIIERVLDTYEATDWPGEGNEFSWDTVFAITDELLEKSGDEEFVMGALGEMVQASGKENLPLVVVAARWFVKKGMV